MTSSHLEIASSVLRLIGVLLLAYPAFYAARYGWLAGRLRRSGPIDNDNPEAVKVYNGLMAKLATLQSDWTLTLSALLLLGTLCTVASSVLAVVKAILS